MFSTCCAIYSTNYILFHFSITIFEFLVALFTQQKQCDRENKTFFLGHTLCLIFTVH